MQMRLSSVQWLGPPPFHTKRDVRGRRSAFSKNIVLAQTTDPFLKVEGVRAEIAATGEGVLKGVNLTVNTGEVYACSEAPSPPQTSLCHTGPCFDGKEWLWKEYPGKGTCWASRLHRYRWIGHIQRTRSVRARTRRKKPPRFVHGWLLSLMFIML